MKKAKLFITLDISGSMSPTKKNIAKNYYLKIKSILDCIYESIDKMFIAHTTTAIEVDEENMFCIGGSGGTCLSAGLKLVENAGKCNGDNFLIIFSDGDNCLEDNDIFIETINNIKNQFKSILVVEIKCSSYSSTIFNRLEEECKSDNITLIKLNYRNDDENDLTFIMDTFQKLKII